MNLIDANLSPFLLRLMSVAQQVADAVGGDGLGNKRGHSWYLLPGQPTFIGGATMGPI